MTPTTRALSWAVSHRIIRTIYPPVDLFEDIADPADWELLVSAEAKTNPRIADEVGNLALVPVARRVGGPGASLVMSAFTHASVDRPGRFSDGRYCAWYCGDRFEVALAETAHHFERFMRATSEPPGETDYRELTCAVQGQVADSSDPAVLQPDDWSAGQALGRTVRDGAETASHTPAFGIQRERRWRCSGRTASSCRSCRHSNSVTAGMASACTGILCTAPATGSPFHDRFCQFDQW